MHKNYCKIEHKWCKYNKKGLCNYCNEKLASISRCPRLTEIETVRFYDLLKKVTFNEVFASITKWFTGQEKSIEGYRNVFNTLLAMTPKKHNLTDLFLNVEKVIEDDGEEWLNIDGITFDKKNHYGIEFEPWIDWISMFITQETLDSFSPEEIVGAAMWEMTFFGFTENHINDERQKLIDSAKECKEYLNNK